MRKLLILLVFISCTSQKEEIQIDVQGHRGARGLYPENTIYGFIEALKLGVTTLELDLVVSGDGQVVVSHEPILSKEICIDTTGNNLDTLINLYQLPYSEIEKYDCGSLFVERFPNQEKRALSKPLLEVVFTEIEQFIADNDLQKVNYNIELKTTIETDSIFHPHPHEFSDLVYQLITEFDLWERVNIQSFDFRTLKYFHKAYPNVRLALLIENGLTWEENIDSLGFIPEIYSCYFPLLTEKIISDLQSNKMLVIPWTVNEEKDIAKMIEWNVDGIISDYPSSVLDLTK